MQIINGSCSECEARVQLSPEAVTVDENMVDPNGSCYSFTCPECGETVTKPAPDAVLRLLRGALGVRWNFVRIPAELHEARPGGPRLTEADVADFLIDLHFTPAHLVVQLAGGRL